jgi:hypothetical protein
MEWFRIALANVLVFAIDCTPAFIGATAALFVWGVI